MKNKYFSGALFVENLKRYWAVPTVGFVIMFMSCQLEMILALNHGRDYSFYDINSALNNTNLGYIFVEGVISVVAAVVVFAYLNKINSVSVHHAMPFSRKKLYITNYLSGLTLAMIPVLITWILFFVLKRPTFIGASTEDIYTVARIFIFLLKGFTFEIFTYSIAVLGCMISGNGIIAFLTAATLQFILPIILIICEGYMQNMLYGYNGSRTLEEILFKLHPVMRFLNSSLRNYSALDALIYIIVALVLAAFGCFLYYKRKLERCGDAYVFEWAKQIVGFLFVFLISSGCGLVFFEAFGYISYILGALIGLLIGQMISRKTFKIFNKKTLKNLVIYAVLMILIIGGFALDPIGFEKKVPDPNDVKEVQLYCYQLTDGDDKYFSDPENIAYITGFHQNIVDNIKTEKMYQDDYYYDTAFWHLTICYELNNGREVERRYAVRRSIAVADENIQALCRSDEMKSNYLKLLSINPEKTEFYWYSEFNDSVNEANKFPAGTMEKRSLIEAIASDMIDRVPGNRDVPVLQVTMHYKDTFADFNIAEAYFKQIAGYNGTSEVTWQSSGNEYVADFSFNIYSDSEHTIEWFKKNGLERFLHVDYQDGPAYMVIRGDYDEDVIHWDNKGMAHISLESKDGYYVTSDTDLIEAVLLKYQGDGNFRDYGKYVELTKNGEAAGVEQTFWVQIFVKVDNGFYERYSTSIRKSNLPSGILDELARYNII